ncbi:hypothetical protein KUL97_06550 [Synechococcus sp. HK05]|uniref:hypothetical protein n=1 Tax=Synechococcus sp. HK05 TaxID=2725975 RepID=UPI001C380700|nr:hypothetical protein [Synechococcus sp. HK05]MBV2351366.1 hypothetical protein [Synechococcus sp. HK05]
MRFSVKPTHKQPFQILRPPLLAVAGGVVVVSAGLLAWALTAQIPVTINGLGTLTPLDSIFSVISPGNGAVLYPIHLSQGQYQYKPPAWSRQAYLYLQEPGKLSDGELYSLIGKVIASVGIYDSERFPIASANSGLASDRDDYRLQFKEHDVIAIVDNEASRTSLASALLALTASIELYQEVQQSQKLTLDYKSEMVQKQKDMLKSYAMLFREGAIGRAAYLEQQLAFSNTKSDKAATLSTLNDIKRQISQNKVDLKNAFAEFLRSSVIFANDPGSVDQFVAPQWSDVQPGEEIMAITWSKRIQPNTIPVFVNPQASTLVSLGNTSIATPAGFSTAEIGGIKGVVTSIGTQPLSLAQISKRLGSAGLAETLGPQGGYQVNVKLEREDSTSNLLNMPPQNRGGFIWNNRSNPPLPPREGMVLNVQITSRRRTPLEMLIPAVKEFTGFAVPQRLQSLGSSPQ